jgi:hypothetical protein
MVLAEFRQLVMLVAEDLQMREAVVVDPFRQERRLLGLWGEQEVLVLAQIFQELQHTILAVAVAEVREEP